MPDSEAMSESGMSGPWKDVVQAAKLVELLQSLVDWIIYVLPDVSREADKLVVNRVFDSAMVYPIKVVGVLHVELVRPLREEQHLAVLLLRLKWRRSQEVARGVDNRVRGGLVAPLVATALPHLEGDILAGIH